MRWCRAGGRGQRYGSDRAGAVLVIFFRIFCFFVLILDRVVDAQDCVAIFSSSFGRPVYASILLTNV